MTAALKFFLIPTFLVVSGDDPEADAATDRRGEGDNVTISASSVSGVRPGGHTDAVTSTQLAEISTMSRMMELGPDGVRDLVSSVLKIDWTLPEGDDAAKNRALAHNLVNLTGTQVGELIGAMHTQLALITDLQDTADTTLGY
jgi:hypothetical protein